MADRSKGAATASVPGLVKDLVDQFSDPLAFYRELIQNSMDAGSNRVDVTLEYDDKTGTARMAVEDDGEGMDERIIDEYFLVLFRSTKEDDLTKIGNSGSRPGSACGRLGPVLARQANLEAGFPEPQALRQIGVAAMREGTLISCSLR